MGGCVGVGVRCWGGSDGWVGVLGGSEVLG